MVLTEGFVYLKDIDATIIEDLRYYRGENFVGRRIDGYIFPSVILTHQAALSLSKAQKELAKDGYSLVVYDAYRPTRAVTFFMKWSTDEKDQIAKDKYYPQINKADVFKLGYICAKSGHSRGSTVDLTIIKLGESLKEIEVKQRSLTDGRIIPLLDDNTIDMGSSFDLFDEASHHETDLINDEFLVRRNYLRKIMQKNGFKDYHEEWWHYTLEDEPYPDTYFNFEIK